MDEKDLIITPLFLIIIYLGAFLYRTKIKDPVLKKYCILALTAKIVGALGLGIVYQFYYPGGDTYNYYHDSSIIYRNFYENFSTGIKLVLHSSDRSLNSIIKEFYWYNAGQNFFVIRAAAIFSLICFNTYSTIACLFAIFSFTGLLSLYNTVSKIFPNYKKQILFSIFFIPSVFFWGSGIMKDTIVIGAIGFAISSFYNIFFDQKINAKQISLLGFSLITISIVKSYIVLALIPSIGLWTLFHYSKNMKSKLLKIVAFPVLLLITGYGGFFITTKLTEGDKYSIDNVINQATVQQNYLQRITEKKAKAKGRDGSAYEISKLDGSLESVIFVVPEALIISFFRPYIFEAKNPVMLLSALESTVVLILFSIIIIKTRFKSIFKIFSRNPILLFFISFSIILGISVGITSGNFGSMVRYRIPFQPFFLLMLLIVSSEAKNYKRIRSN